MYLRFENPNCTIVCGTIIVLSCTHRSLGINLNIFDSTDPDDAEVGNDHESINDRRSLIVVDRRDDDDHSDDESDDESHDDFIDIDDIPNRVAPFLFYPETSLSDAEVETVADLTKGLYENFYRIPYTDSEDIRF